VILLENNPNSIALTIATLILLNIGVVPLVVSSLGFLQMMQVFLPTPPDSQNPG
jgi:hypothetical protein